MTHLYIESYGVRIDVEVEDDSLLPAVDAILPPFWSHSADFPEDGHLAVLGRGEYAVVAEGEPVATGLSREIAIHVLGAHLRSHVATFARDRIFVHAGVVAVKGRAIVLPAQSFAGKSTLVAALIIAGATYYSDEFAVLDADGRVHPYPKPLSIRPPNARYGEMRFVEELGGTAATAPAAVSLIAVTHYVPGAQWSPTSEDARSGALALLTNTVPARLRPQQSLRAVGAASDGARVLKGPRGEAAECAGHLLAALAS